MTSINMPTMPAMPAMPAMSNVAVPSGEHRARLSEADCRIDTFAELVSQSTDLADYPNAQRVERNVLVYDAAVVRSAVSNPAVTEELAGEFARALMDGPGVVVFENAFTDHLVLDKATEVFDAIIADESASGSAAGDHFAAPGANSRVWNALEKLALRDPCAFVDYYSNEVLAFASNSWLGPAYQMTSQINVVRPGGKAQNPHRDFHLGFLDNHVVEKYPTHVHVFSAQLTLQGAVAHCDMPIESGPTMYLPFSQRFVPGYLAWRLPEFRQYFDEYYVQLPLRKGDAVFFNPALFHGAGTNVSTSIQRMANLIQVSSAFGRAMESVDRSKISKAIYPILRQRRTVPPGPDSARNALVAATDGYPFPTNLDADQPLSGLTPLAQTELVEQALSENWEPVRLHVALDAYDFRRTT
jgi:ectoine hydroxylase-related dioxygenase (phytanoyl-CoA dioxygenase family)